jgi:chromate transporter
LRFASANSRHPIFSLPKILTFVLCSGGAVDSTSGRRDNGRMNSPPPAVSARPQSLTDLFVSFTLLALQGFGGVLAVVQREVVDRKQWLTQDEFLEDWAVAQIMPGPNVVNLALMIGGRYFGLAGAMAALGGLLALPLLLVLVLAMLRDSFADVPAVAGALRGMAAVSAGLIGATGLKMAVALRRSPMPLAWCAAIGVVGFVLVALLQWPLFYVLLGLGGLGCVLTWRRLKS